MVPRVEMKRIRDEYLQRYYDHTDDTEK
jgi:hypothetical protein